ncbi:host-nuclease inhibitor Gam family protein [bacterium]|nr:host-nuclease inhibitor Gam family protein [bacterium]
MAKKKESIFRNWEEIDDNLKKLGQLKIEKSKLEGELTIKINGLKDEYSTKCNIISNEIKAIEKEISRFCEQNKDVFFNKRSKKLNFGLIAYRISEKVVIPCVSSTIKALKALNYDFCIRIKEEIEKEEVKKLDSNILAKIGVKIDKEDKLSIEPDIIEIAASAQ